jgi:uncharacterized protein (TIGR02147 family)
MLSVFSYNDPAQYLTDAFEQKREKNPAFSLRSWAMQLGMKSHGPLHAMLKGQRNIPKKYVPLFIKSFKLEKKEASFFEALVDLQRAKSIEEKEMYSERLKALGPKVVREVSEIEAYKFISEPLHSFMLEMTQLKDFKSSLGWIKSKLRQNVNLKVAEDTLERLQSLGVLELINEKFQRQSKHISTAKDTMNKAIQEHHRKVLELAASEISKQDVEKREYNSVTFNIKKKDIPKIKAGLRELTDQIIQNYESKPGEGEETYHLSLQFFSLTDTD